MTDNSVIDLDNFQAILDRFEVHSSPSEIHGMMTGLLCGGTKFENCQWSKIIADFYNQGLEFHEQVTLQLELMFKQVWSSLIDEQMSFKPLVPDDDEILSIRSKALADWSQGFLLGFGVNKQVLVQASAEVNEAIHDIAEIGKLSTDIDDSAENETAFFEVFEYVRISILMCFTELGDSPGSKEKITLH